MTNEALLSFRTTARLSLLYKYKLGFQCCILGRLVLAVMFRSDIIFIHWHIISKHQRLALLGRYPINYLFRGFVLQTRAWMRAQKIFSYKRAHAIFTDNTSACNRADVTHSGIPARYGCIVHDLRKFFCFTRIVSSVTHSSTLSDPLNSSADERFALCQRPL